MELQRLAEVLRIAVLLAQLVRHAAEHRAVNGVGRDFHDLELSVGDGRDLHAVVADYVYRELAHLAVYPWRVSAADHNAGIPPAELVERLEVPPRHGRAVLAESGIEVHRHHALALPAQGEVQQMRIVGGDPVRALVARLPPVCRVLRHPEADREPRLMRLRHHFLRGLAQRRRHAAASKVLRRRDVLLGQRPAHYVA